MPSVVSAQTIKQGDIIVGPDGPSTVVSIRSSNGLLHFDFAEGKGNRCWSGLRLDEKVQLTQKSNSNIPCGFAVDREGKVVLRNIANVSVDENSLEFLLVSGAIRRIAKSAISHVIGDFTFKIR